MSVTITPTETVPEALAALVNAANTLEAAMGSGGAPVITLSTPTIPEQTAAGTAIGALSINLPGTWTFAFAPGGNANGKAQIVGPKGVQTTASPFVYLVQQSYMLEVSATSADGKTIIQLPVAQPLTITQVNHDGPAATASMDFVSAAEPVYTGGAAIGDIGVSAPQLSPLGLYIDAAPAEYLTANSMDGHQPTSIGTLADDGSQRLSPGGSQPPADTDGFNAFDWYSQYNEGLWEKTTLRKLAVGEFCTLKFRVMAQPPGQYSANAMRWRILGAMSHGTDYGFPWQMPDFSTLVIPDTRGCIITATRPNPMEIEVVMTFQADTNDFATLVLNWDQDLIPKGCQMVSGKVDQPWYPTGDAGQAIIAPFPGATEPTPAYSGSDGYGPVAGQPYFFNAAWYGHANPDVAGYYNNDASQYLGHFLNNGIKENPPRTPYNGATEPFLVSTLPPVPGTYQTTTVPASIPTLGGPIAAVLEGAAWTLTLEGNGNGLGASLGNFVTYGTTGTENVLLKAGGRSHATSGDGTPVAPALTSGFLGIWRCVIASDASGAKLYFNGGQPVSLPRVAVSGVVKLLAGNAAYLRRIEAWNTRLADIYLTYLSDPRHYVHPDASLGKAAPPKGFTQTYFEDFDASFHIAQRADPFNPNPSVGADSAVDYYQDARVASANATRYWSSRYKHWTDPMGSVGKNLGSEVPILMDQQWIDAQRAAGRWTDPFDAVKAGLSSPHAPANSVLRMGIKATAHLDAQTQTLIPTTDGTSNTGKYPYLGSAMTTPDIYCNFKPAGSPIFQTGMTYGCRMRGFQLVYGLWSGIWAITYYWGWESDLQEQTGAAGDDILTSIHAPKDTPAVNQGIRNTPPFHLVDDFDVYELYWANNKQHISISGAYLGYNPTDSAFEGSQQFLLLDLTMSGGGFAGTADATTLAAMAALPNQTAYFEVDHIGLVQNI